MDNCFLHSLVAVPLVFLFSGCRSGYAPEQLIRIEHPAYVAEMIRPETADFGKDNARFSGGGWLLRLTPKSSGENIFYDNTMIPDHHAYGLPVEFDGTIPLGEDMYLRIGSGIVKCKPGKHPIRAGMHERFPWFSEVRADAAGTTVRFYQLAPRFYFYTRDVRFEDSTRRIVFSDEFLNLSGSTIKSQVYFHPFFRVRGGAVPWCRMDSTPDFTNPEHPALPGEGAIFFTVGDNPEKKSWFVCGAEKPLAALRVENAARVGYWRQKNDMADVFAVEPYMPLEVAPWKTAKWSWEIEIP